MTQRRTLGFLWPELAGTGALRLGEHAVPIASIVLCLVVGWWVVTGGTFHPFKPYDSVLATFYDVQGESILSGRLDVPCSAIRKEAFVIDGRCYGYFGVTPSLLRLPLNALFPAHRGHWAGLSLIAASALFLVSSYAICVTIRRDVLKLRSPSSRFAWLAAGFLIALGLGSTNIFLLSRTVVHHEATIWASALALCSIFFVLRHVVLGSRKAFGVAVVLALLAIHARPPAGLTAAAACAIGAAARVLLYEPGAANAGISAKALTLLKSSWAMIGIVSASAIVASYAGLNYAKLGTIGGMPLRYYVSSNPALEEYLRGSLFHVENARWNLSNQFGLEGLKAKPAAPFFEVSIRMQGEAAVDQERLRYPEALIGGIEPYVSMSVGMTALLLLTVAGIIYAMRGPASRVLMLGLLAPTLIGPIVSLMFAYVSYRYFHEYAILFAVAGAIAVCHLAQHKTVVEKTLPILLAMLVAANVLLNIGFAIHYQTSDTNLGPPVREMKETVERFHKLLGNGFANDSAAASRGREKG